MAEHAETAVLPGKRTYELLYRAEGELVVAYYRSSGAQFEVLCGAFRKELLYNVDGVWDKWKQLLREAVEG